MNRKNSSNDYVIQVLDHPALVDARAWNSLLEAQAAPTPFMRHEYLLALHESASANSQTGWTPQFLTLTQDEILVAACPLYLKGHSHGEYVFDWAWADAYQRHGLHYFPKLLSAVPFTPVPGSRLMAHDGVARIALLSALRQFAIEAKLSSVHILFLAEADQQAARTAGWMMRSTVQFHWLNRTPQGYTDFSEFLSSLRRDKRKKIQQERRQVADAGVTFTTHQGTSLQSDDWDFFYRCYTLTYQAHRSTPYLTRDFFERIAHAMPDNWLLFIAWKNQQRIAASLIGIDPERGHAFGRYWGALESVSCLHFEACYYQPLQWCIAHQYLRFEGGAQGEHKMARGLLPLQTWSAHWLAHPQFAQAVAEYLHHEGADIGLYLEGLEKRQPFK